MNIFVHPIKTKGIMSSEWKIYTRKGDAGETSLLGGSRVDKNHPRIEAYGTLDELNSFIGFLRDSINDEHLRAVLLQIMEQVFTAESRLAADNNETRNLLPLLTDKNILLLEDEIDKMNVTLPSLANFILPGGHISVSAAHIARTVCRRAEREVIKLRESYHVEEIIIRYLNRLSDYFFVLARKLAHDSNIPEITWKPDVNNSE